MTVFTIETLNALGARLFDHADSITNPAPSRHGSRLPASCSRSFKLRNSVSSKGIAARGRRRGSKSPPRIRPVWRMIKRAAVNSKLFKPMDQHRSRVDGICGSLCVGGTTSGRGAAPGHGASTSTPRFAAQSLRGRSVGRWNGAPGMNCPEPGCPRILPLSHTISPRRIVVIGSPVTSLPS